MRIGRLVLLGLVFTMATAGGFSSGRPAKQGADAFRPSWIVLPRDSTVRSGTRSPAPAPSLEEGSLDFSTPMSQASLRRHFQKTLQRKGFEVQAGDGPLADGTIVTAHDWRTGRDVRVRVTGTQGWLTATLPVQVLWSRPAAGAESGWRALPARPSRPRTPDTRRGFVTGDEVF